MVYRWLIALLLFCNFCFGQKCDGVLVRIKNVGTLSTEKYIATVNIRKTHSIKDNFEIKGLKSGECSSYICLWSQTPKVAVIAYFKYGNVVISRILPFILTKKFYGKKITISVKIDFDKLYNDPRKDDFKIKIFINIDK